jgi:hypothetical protein
MNGTLAAVSECAMVPNVAVFRGFGEMAEWFKAAVLKTAPENTGNTSFPARLAEFRRRSTRVRAVFARNTSAQESAQ